MIHADDSFTRRLSSLLDLAEAWLHYFEAVDPESEEKQGYSESFQPDSDITALLLAFIRFARSYYENFTTNNNVDSMENTRSKVIKNLQNSWDNISRACEQRMLSKGFPQTGLSIRGQLKEADRLAEAYYQNFTGPRLGLPTVYFEKYHAVIRHQFSPCVLISIPMQFYDDPTQWNALAHELGHHIFWNAHHFVEQGALHDHLGRTVASAVAFIVPSRDFGRHISWIATWLNWTEETVADISGTLMAGISYVRSAQALAIEQIKEKPKSQKPVEDVASQKAQTGWRGEYAEAEQPQSVPRAPFIAGDSDHPSAYIRPLIAIETLEWVAQNWKLNQVGRKALVVEIKALRQQWMDELQRRGLDNLQTFSGLPFKVVSDSIEAVVRAILDAGWGKFDEKGEFQKAGYGEFFNPKASWITKLPEIEKQPDPVYETQDAPPDDPDPFATLLEALKERFSKITELSNDVIDIDDRVDEALLNFSLITQRFLDWPFSAPVQPTTPFATDPRTVPPPANTQTAQGGWGWAFFG
jgi:hypothetical protein